MKTINKQLNTIETIKKSKFLTFLMPITSLENAKEIINKYKEEYKDATHICYSYILDENTFKYYDDGEPNNSAGLPIYQTLKNNKLVYVLAIVIRYFGGIKLGVGGLSHAYSNGVISLLKNNMIEYKKYNEYIVELNYNEFDNFNYYLNKKGIVITNKQFLDTVFISIKLDENSLNYFKNTFPNLNFILSK